MSEKLKRVREWQSFFVCVRVCVCDDNVLFHVNNRTPNPICTVLKSQCCRFRSVLSTDHLKAF